jgi:hypothetical protein
VESPAVPPESPDLVQRRAEIQEQDAVKIAGIRENLGLIDQTSTPQATEREQQEPILDNGERLAKYKKTEEIEKDTQIKNVCTKIADSLDNIVKIANLKNSRGPAPFFKPSAAGEMRNSGESLKRLSGDLDVIDEKKVNELYEIFSSLNRCFDGKNILEIGITEDDEKKLIKITSALESLVQDVSRFESHVSSPDARKFGDLGSVASSLKNRLKRIDDFANAKRVALRRYLRH